MTTIKTAPVCAPVTAQLEAEGAASEVPTSVTPASSFQGPRPTPMVLNPGSGDVLPVKTAADIEKLPVWRSLHPSAAEALKAKLTKAIDSGVALALTVGSYSISVAAKARKAAPSTTAEIAELVHRRSGRTDAPQRPDVSYVNSVADLAALPDLSGMHPDAAAEITAKVTEALHTGRALSMTVAGQAIFVPSRLNRPLPEKTASDARSTAELVARLMNRA